MKTDLLLCNEIVENLGFEKTIQVDIILFSNKKDLMRKLDQSKEELKIVEGSANNRDVLELKKPDILLSPEKGVKKDFTHQKNSGLNHVLCNLARKNEIAIGFNFNSVLKAEPEIRAKIIGRMMQNVKLCRKYKLRMVLATFATKKYEQRDHSSLLSFAKIIGMSPGEAKKSLETYNLIKDKEKNKNFIAKGVKDITK